MDVMLHPVAWAGWAGLLVTGMNLIPAGQLDGGHLLYTLFGSKANRALPVILILLGLLAIVWQGWLLLLFLILVFGRLHAEPLDQITQLDGRRKALALLGLIVFVLVFTPIPLKVLGG
jgi:membrane-associated protease RseP (regulator of RpoE activity)